MARNLTLAAFLGTCFLVFGWGGGAEIARAQGCLSQGEARSAVASGQAAPLSAFVGGLRSSGDVVSSQLCDRGGRLVYVVNVVNGNGQVSRVTIDARSGAKLK